MYKTNFFEGHKISVIIPIFNEIDIIELFHLKLVRELTVLKMPFEIIYIDDHSNDGTYEWLVKNLKFKTKNYKLRGEVFVYEKEGKKGKGFSLIEGFEKGTGDILVMIDGDLQYNPSEIGKMVEKLKANDIVIADRVLKNINFGRKIGSRVFRFLIGKSLFGVNSDVQSGLKVFKREVWERVRFIPSSAWTFDLEFLHRSVIAGLKLCDLSTSFSKRKEGYSKVSLITSSVELGLNALILKLKGRPSWKINPDNKLLMRGAGIEYKNVKYITHTGLSLNDLAFQTFSKFQIFLLISLIILFSAAFYRSPLETIRGILSFIIVLYFIDTVFNFYLIVKSIREPMEITFSDKELNKIDDSSLPVYSILCPLYKEADLIPQFLDAISKLNWPKQKLDVMLLLEDDDTDTINQVNKMVLPYYVRVLRVPHSLPKTKPKACNYGLTYAKGKYLVVFDAEDVPDRLQLKKVYLGFQNLPSNVGCLQAKLNYYNPKQNLLTRFFTAEYSLWFDLKLTGLQSLNSIIPLGGTSNHFRTNDLREMQGWDSFNVTEDADLGVRLFKKGYKTAIIDSTTLEEANSNFHNWLRQRSRWFKGYMQTYLVHMRDIRSFVGAVGWKHALIFQFTIGSKFLFPLINPFMWITTILYFVFHNELASIIEKLFNYPILYLAVFSWIFGNFLFLYYYMLACARRSQWDLLKYIYLIPVYWAMMSHAAGIALHQLIFQPHYWEKTIHGFHLGKPAEAVAISQRKIMPEIAFANLTHRIYVVIYYLLFFTADILVVYSLYPKTISLPFMYISIAGKSIYVLSQVISFSLLPLIRKLFSNLNGVKKVNLFIFSTFIISWIGIVLFGFQLIPYFDTSAVNFELISYGMAMMYFAMGNVLVIYHLKKKVNVYLVVSYIVMTLDLTVLYLTNADLAHIVRMTVYLSGSNILFMFLLYLNKHFVGIFENNIGGIFQLLQTNSIRKSWEERRMRILIFNWRDIKHNYSGGAEVYIHELGKRWVKQGNKVTVFCANDNRNPDYEVIDGVEIFRRGGMYTVYFFALIYYLFKFVGRYDLIIDCENGIPFFTPFYVREPIVLIIHHVHQKIIRKYLAFPLNILGWILEAKLMPYLYKNKKVITVSKSSKKAIIKLGFTDKKNIDIVYNGSSVDGYVLNPKTKYPSFLYLGRLQDYKNIDIAISAFAKIIKKYKNARFDIVGFGESYTKLTKLVKTLGVKDNIKFYGKVTDKRRTKLYSQAWSVIQPSQLEGWGITVIEANACGTPVIASKVDGLRDSVVDGRTGILVENGNIELFAEAMERLILDTQLRNKLSREAFIWSQNFSWSKSADQFYKLIGMSISRPNYRPVGNLSPAQ